MIRRPGPSFSLRVGILQFLPSLEDAAWGFMGALEERIGFRPRFDLMEANGDEIRCGDMAAVLADHRCDLLFECPTPAAAALAKAASSTRTPVLFAPVFHPVLSGLVGDEDRPAGHVTGVTGRLDPGEKIAKLDLLFPDLEAVTVLSDGKDPISLWEARSLVGAFSKRGIRAEAVEVDADPPEPSEPGRVHLLAFAPRLEESLERWIGRFLDASAPVVGSSARAGFSGAVMAVFVDHGDLGRIAGEMAAEILGGRPPGEMPVRHPPGARIGFNYRSAGRLGIRIPPPVGQTADIL